MECATTKRLLGKRGVKKEEQQMLDGEELGELSGQIQLYLGNIVNRTLNRDTQKEKLKLIKHIIKRE